MSQPLGTYSFLPWLRQGLANQIQSADFDPAVAVRARVSVQLELRGEKLGGGTQVAPVNRPVELFGPGDIVGIDRRAIVRVEPRDWITNFEPNYLAHVEFYDEDFPWRYTPAAPDLVRGRLRPWIALVVLEEGEFEDGKDITGRPLPYIDVPDLGVFPRAEELWAWAHVHVNESLAAGDAEFVSKDMNAVIPRLESVLRRNPDLAYSRLVCPRKLAENAAYHAFVIPVFEVGRRAGLGLELEDTPATMSAWDPGARPEGQSFPFYHRWFFRTGASGDFESLVRLLVPKPVDPRVGTREMDVQDPGSNVRPLDKPELGGILKLGGALRPPTPVPAPPPDKFETWDAPFPRPLQLDLARLINLADDYQAQGDPDPIITPPLYGTWHALMKRVLTERDGTAITPAENWVHRLNLDPRFRAAAGFGTRVIQDNQEKYMDAAWEQIGEVLEARRRIRFGQFGVMVSGIWYDRHLLPTLGVSRQKALLMMAPLNKRVLTAGSTVHFALGESFVQPTMTSAALRRIVRPRGRLIRTLPFDAALPPDRLLERVNDGEVSAAPPKVAPPGVLTYDEVADEVLPSDAPPWLVDWLRRFPRLPLVVLLIAILIALLLFLFLPVAVAPVAAAAVVAVGVYLYRRLTRLARAVRASDLLRVERMTPEAVDRLPGGADFRIAEPGSGFVPRGGGGDSVEAARFKAALREGLGLIQASDEVGAVVPKKRLDLGRVANDFAASLKPERTIPKRLLAGIFVPPRVLDGIVVRPEVFVEPMAYPVIDQPMYEPLKDRSAELFLPNINLIEHNSITLLETNQRFIESYMVGLNHEFARELLWREYPTDQRGSTFRQFWDVRSFFNAENLDDEALKEKLRDIPPLHLWSKGSLLGSHDNREEGGADEDELVLVIRGELLKRYPTAVIYAHRACWQRQEVTAADHDMEPCLRSGAIDPKQERRLAPLTPAEEAQPPRTKVLTPLYEAKVDPDIYFFGFDLTVEKAKGGTGEDPNDDPGWFFVIKERPGEPRFGLDSEQPTTRSVWNDLSWPDVQPDPPGSYIEIAAAPASLPLTAPGVADQEKAVQHQDDKKVAWSHDMSSAELAYILWQAPVLVAVHASEMLPK
ncbi:MAG TPA: hypothetical protein VF586_06605 [Pyrinomonadaceae bacterium]|jgi:hypothetical protein